MPRPGPYRPMRGVRLTEDGWEHIDQRARDEGILKRNGEPNRSEMIRLMLAYASTHMPKGWRPK